MVLSLQWDLLYWFDDILYWNGSYADQQYEANYLAAIAKPTIQLPPGTCRWNLHL